jgi:hypothetical protein
MHIAVCISEVVHMYSDSWTLSCACARSWRKCPFHRRARSCSAEESTIVSGSRPQPRRDATTCSCGSRAVPLGFVPRFQRCRRCIAARSRLHHRPPSPANHAGDISSLPCCGCLHASLPGRGLLSAHVPRGPERIKLALPLHRSPKDWAPQAAEALPRSCTAIESS